MNAEKLLSPKLQLKVRRLMHIIIIEENLMVKDVIETSELGYNSVHKFLQQGKDVGPIAMRKFLHFVTARPKYKLEDLIDITDEPGE